MTELAGVLVGEYFLLECLSREGQVEMYRARPTTKAGYDVLLRIFRPPFPDPTNFHAHFPTEVEKIWHCQHEGLLPLHEFGAGDELLYCVTIFPAMDTVEQYMKQQTLRTLPLAFVLRLIIQLCDSVHYLHTHDIVHGNIQPSSIYLRDGHDPLLTNYGMRRAYQEGDPLASLLDEGNIAYVAPEQSLGMLCPESDIYALGILFYRLLIGSYPFDGATPEEITWQHSNQPVPSLCVHIPELPTAVETIVRKSLAKRPEQRFPSARLFAEALLAALMEDEKQNLVSEPDNTEPRRVHIRTRRTLFSRTRIPVKTQQWSRLK